MSSNKKYQYELQQDGDTWSAKITRKINVNTRKTTMAKSDFASEVEAKSWAEQSLLELAKKQQSGNLAQGQKRKDTEELKRQRSARRAVKTEQAKAEAAKIAQQEEDELAAMDAAAEPIDAASSDDVASSED